MHYAEKIDIDLTKLHSYEDITRRFLDKTKQAVHRDDRTEQVIYLGKDRLV